MLKLLPLIMAASCLLIPSPVAANDRSSLHQSASTCPKDLESLTSLLIPQIPSYANRVIQKSRRLKRNYDFYSYVVIAGKPEFEPLELTHQEYTPVFPEASQQLFFTTLERKYVDNMPVETQNYHWIFLTYTSNGWQLVMAFSRFGSSFPDSLPFPPENTTNSVIGEAVRLWLRDCESGSLRGDS